MIKELRPFFNWVLELYGDRELIGAEIGVASGYHADRVTQYIKFKEFHLIDIWEPYLEKGRLEDRYYQLYEETQRRFLGRNYIFIHKQESVKAAQEFSNNYFDFVYIDGNHQQESVSQDIESWLPKIKAGGLIGGHDYTSGWQCVAAAVDDWRQKLTANEVKFEFRQHSPDWGFVF